MVNKDANAKKKVFKKIKKYEKEHLPVKFRNDFP